MKTVEADENDKESARCFNCEQEIKDGRWFARIKWGNGRVLFCRPRCVEMFLERSRATDSNGD